MTSGQGRVADSVLFVCVRCGAFELSRTRATMEGWAFGGKDGTLVCPACQTAAKGGQVKEASPPKMDREP